MQTLYVTQSHCKQGAVEKAQLEMLFHLNSRFNWKLSATHVHIHIQSDNRSSVRKEQTPFLSQINSATLSVLVTSQNLVLPVHLLIPAYTWQIQQHRTLINRNTGYAQPKSAASVEMI